MKSIWIETPKNIKRNEQADIALTTVNDISYWSDELGIVQVDDERWKKTLNFKKHNTPKMKHDYKMLPKRLGNVLEIDGGSQPRVIYLSRKQMINRVTLIDRHVIEYQRQPECHYHRITPRPHMLALGITEYHKIHEFDTIIAVDFLEQTKDAILALNNIEKALRKHGIIIFTAQTYDRFDPNKVYDAGKPIRVKRKLIDIFKKRFEILDQNEQSHEYGQEINFIGRIN